MGIVVAYYSSSIPNRPSGQETSYYRALEGFKAYQKTSGLFAKLSQSPTLKILEQTKELTPKG